MRVHHGGLVPPRWSRGYDRTMTVLRTSMLLCLAALAAAGAHAGAQDDSRRAEPEETSVPSPAAGSPSRFSREGYRPPSPSSPAAAPNASAPRYDPRTQRIESLRNRYQMPREISQDMHRAIQDAQREHGGKVLSADRMRNDGRDVYRVKLLTRSGRVRVVQLPKNDDAPKARAQQGEQ